MALQVGSLYDESIERRGWTDPTSLVEHVDLLINDDVFMYRPQFSFVADYMRSICRFWNATRTDHRTTQFATETNWPGYN